MQHTAGQPAAQAQALPTLSWLSTRGTCRRMPSLSALHCKCPTPAAASAKGPICTGTMAGPRPPRAARYCDEKPVAVKRLALCPQIPLARSRFGPGQCCSPALVHRSAWQATPMARHTPRYWRPPGPSGQSMRHGCHRSSYHQPLPSYGHQCPPAPPRSSRRAKRGPRRRRTRSAGPEATLPQATSLPVKARAVAALIHPVHRLGSALRSGNFLATAIHVQFCEWM